MIPETVGYWNKSCCITDRLDGKLAIVTGANTGIGKCTAGELARRGATVIMACRNMEKAEEAKRDLLNKYGVNNADSVKIDLACPSMSNSMTTITEDQLILKQLDLSSLDSIRAFVKQISESYTKIDYLINNAGLNSPHFKQTQNGFEMIMGVNYLGPYLLTDLLLPLMYDRNKDKNNADNNSQNQNSQSRIINVSSDAHYYIDLNRPDLFTNEKDYKFFNVYRQSKLANVMYTIELNERLKETNIIIVSLHPGVVKTDILRDFDRWYLKILRYFVDALSVSSWQGAQTILYTVLSKNLISGGYYANCQLKEPNEYAKITENRKWLWNKSRELIGLPLDS